MQLPESYPLPIQHLAGVFKSSRVTNSYKFYWFLSILQILKSRPSNSVINMQEIAVLMISNVWYPINYYRLSFGKQDQLANVVANLKTLLNIQSNTKKQALIPLIQAQLSEKEVEKVVKSILTYVPYRFLSPWFANELRGKKDGLKNGLIADFAQKHFHTERPSLYRFSKQTIEIQAFWLAYLQKHITILEGFCLWHLVKHLQKNNPNVPNIADKLFEPKERKLSNAKEFWKNYLQEKPQVNCIYSNQTLDKSFSIDHFLPWSFVTHDQLWNLVPTPKYVNSSKSDHLPNLDSYFDRFSTLQFDAFQLNFKKGKLFLLEDYTILFKEDSKQIADFSKSTFQTKLQQHISPMIQIASNLGFPSNWVYKPL